MRLYNVNEAATAWLAPVDSVRRAADAAWSFLLTDMRQETRFASTLQRLLILALQEANQGCHYQRELSKCLKQLLEEGKYNPYLREKVEGTLNVFNQRVGYRLVLGEGGKLRLVKIMADGDKSRKAALTIVFDPRKSRMYYGPPADWLQLSDAEKLSVANETQPERRYLKEVARLGW
jgi:hypothetical protein